MAPLPDNEDNHYDGGSPLDGGGSPSTNLGGNSVNLPPSGMEIGVIVGVVSLVVISVVALFVWRSRKARAAKDVDALAATDAGHQGSSVGNLPVPPKDRRSSTLANDKASELERQAHNRLHPVSDWDHWGQPRSRVRGMSRSLHPLSPAIRTFAVLLVALIDHMAMDMIDKK
ncbi:hypothetical protein F4775DRAFT_535537 [Biscogniauxia sp. FL1348]|nr:hypothetical protein F4775DRAFT_535537 [Biscogniauxia sp. FL1348]